MKTIDEKEMISPQIDSLREQIMAGNTAALEAFWLEVAHTGAPVIEPFEGDNKYCLVTFLWRATKPVRNVVVVGPMVNMKPALNQMVQLEDTDLWFKTYCLRRDLRALYRLSPDDTLIPYDGAKEEYALRPTWQADPFNPERFNPEPEDPTPQDALMSVLSLPDAPPQPWIHSLEGVPRGKLEEHTIQSDIMQNERSITVYTPPGYSTEEAAYPLFILFTGYYYNNLYIPGPTILNNMIAAGVIPPLVTVFMGKSPNSDYEYSCNLQFTQFLERELVLWLHEHYQVTADPARTIIGGVSYTGMTAAFIAMICPGTFGNVLSQSGYFAWKPEGDEEPEWLARKFAFLPCLPIRFYLDVGQLEHDTYGGGESSPSLLLSNRHLRDVLQAKGNTVCYQEFNGTHDGVSWRGTWSDGLMALLAERQPKIRK